MEKKMLVDCRHNFDLKRNIVVAGKGDNMAFAENIAFKSNYIIFGDILSEQFKEELQKNGYDVLKVENADFEVDKDKPVAVFMKQTVNYDSSEEDKKEYAQTVEKVIRKVGGDVSAVPLTIMFFKPPIAVDNYFVKAEQRNHSICLFLDSYADYAKCNGSDIMIKIFENAVDCYYTGGLTRKDSKYIKWLGFR